MAKTLTKKTAAASDVFYVIAGEKPSAGGVVFGPFFTEADAIESVLNMAEGDEWGETPITVVRHVSGRLLEPQTRYVAKEID